MTLRSSLAASVLVLGLGLGLPSPPRAPTVSPLHPTPRAIPAVPVPSLVLLERAVAWKNFWMTVEVYCDTRRGNLLYWMGLGFQGSLAVIPNGCPKK